MALKELLILGHVVALGGSRTNKKAEDLGMLRTQMWAESPTLSVASQSLSFSSGVFIYGCRVLWVESHTSP